MESFFIYSHRHIGAGFLFAGFIFSNRQHQFPYLFRYFEHYPNSSFDFSFRFFWDEIWIFCSYGNRWRIRFFNDDHVLTLCWFHNRNHGCPNRIKLKKLRNRRNYFLFSLEKYLFLNLAHFKLP